MHRSSEDPEGPRQAASHDVVRTPGHRGRPERRTEDASDPSCAGSTGLTNTSAARSPRQKDRDADHFSAPLGSARSGRLRFTGGAHGVVVRSDPHVLGLCSARFGGRVPIVGLRDGVVSVRYPGTPTDDRSDSRSGRPAEIALNGAIPWDVEIRGGASRIAADLRGLRLGSLVVSGGAGRLELFLPFPVGTVAVVFDGGVSNVNVGCPAGVPARLRVEGGVTYLRFGDRRIGAAGDVLDLRARGYDVAADRYDLYVKGGANELSVGPGVPRSRVAGLDR